MLDLVEQMAGCVEGGTVTLALSSADDLDAVRAWCEHAGNSVVEANGSSVTVRRGLPLDPIAELPADRRPGARLWIYTNFHCNLACDYCCVRSSPKAEPRSLSVADVSRLVLEGAEAGVHEVLLTGGEPFLLPEIGAMVAASAEVLPTTLLTNGMLFRGRRLATLRAMPRDVRLQISLDSSTPARHDEHRGRGSWKRSVDGIRTALAEGFRVRVAATVAKADATAERELRAFLDGLGIAREDQVLRPLALQGFATEGVELSAATLVPEITVTAEGVSWHPVGADDAGLRVSTELFPLAPAIARVRELFREYRTRADAAAQSFPCA